MEVVVETGVFVNLIEATQSAGFGIRGAVYACFDARLVEEACTHEAGLECNVDDAVKETPAPKFCGCLLNGQEFCVSRGLVFGLAQVMSARYDEWLAVFR